MKRLLAQWAKIISDLFRVELTSHKKNDMLFPILLGKKSYITSGLDNCPFFLWTLPNIFSE